MIFARCVLVPVFHTLDKLEEWVWVAAGSGGTKQAPPAFWRFPKMTSSGPRPAKEVMVFVPEGSPLAKG